ncbi:MAG: trigger factor [Lachnospiraceae bacterium]|nr:trigger factor [Lachnospiraceae bacterium]
MKKKFMAVALVLAMTAGLSACGKTTKVKLCEYKGIALQSVSQEEIDEKIDSYIAQSFVESREIDGPIESGDTAYINYVGTKDGVAFDGGTDNSEEGFPLVIGSGRFIEGFEDGLVGVKKGETKVLDLSFPENYGNEELNGAAVKFEVTVKKITRKYDLEVNDENVKKLLGYDTVQIFKDTVKDDLNYQSYTEQLGTFLSENCTTSNLPEDEINEYCDSVYTYAMQSVQQYASYYGVDVATMLQASLGFENEEALRNYCLEGATQNVAYQYIIKEIAKKEKIVVTDEEVSARGSDYADKYGFSSVEELIAQTGEKEVKEAILMDMTIEFLIANAQIF